MNIVTMVLGILCIGYGIYTIIARIKSPEKFGKLDAMKQRFGEKAGMILHIISYSLIPLLTGIAFIAAGAAGVNIF